MNQLKPNEWYAMWIAIVKIESTLQNLIPNIKYKVQEDIDLLKEKITSVIGKVE
jgi:hypothetical protein